MKKLTVILTLVLMLSPCAVWAQEQELKTPRLTTPFFDGVGQIPADQTCEGKNISPALFWTDMPRETKSFALTVIDSDAPAGTWTHWVVYNIPGDAVGLQPGMPAGERGKDGMFQGRNDFGKAEYGGPCPPPGKGEHRYIFMLYALDAAPDLPPGKERGDLEAAMKDHIIAQAGLTGRFSR